MAQRKALLARVLPDLDVLVGEASCGSHTDGNELRREAWRKVAVSLNAACSQWPRRDYEECRRQWQGVKSKAMKKFTANRGATGNNKAAEYKLDACEQIVIKALQEKESATLEGIPGGFDSLAKRGAVDSIQEEDEEVERQEDQEDQPVINNPAPRRAQVTTHPQSRDASDPKAPSASQPRAPRQAHAESSHRHGHQHLTPAFCSPTGLDLSTEMPPISGPGATRVCLDDSVNSAGISGPLQDLDAVGAPARAGSPALYSEPEDEEARESSTGRNPERSSPAASDNSRLVDLSAERHLLEVSQAEAGGPVPRGRPDSSASRLYRPGSVLDFKRKLNEEHLLYFKDARGLVQVDKVCIVASWPFSVFLLPTSLTDARYSSLCRSISSSREMLWP